MASLSERINGSNLNLYPNFKLKGTGGYTIVNRNKQVKNQNLESAQGDAGVSASGPPSLMTPDAYDDKDNLIGSYSITTLHGKKINGDYNDIGTDNTFLRDKSIQSPWYDLEDKAKEPTTTEIINWSKQNDKTRAKPYKYTDFVFCKYWNKIPNNRLITLRRYAYPVWDNLEFPDVSYENEPSVKFYSPISQAITYLGEETGNKISDILKFSCGLDWSELKSSVHIYSAQEPGADKNPNINFAGIGKILGLVNNGSYLIQGMSDEQNQQTFEKISNNGEVPPDPYDNGPFMNRVLGPVNKITKTYRRGSEEGLKFEHDLKLVFHYVARPIDGINTKAVMLDIVANLLLLTYAEASFWGGLIRFRNGSPAYPFLGGTNGWKKWYAGDPIGFFESYADQVISAKDTFLDVFGSLLNSIMSGDGLSTLKNVANKAIKLGMAEAIRGNKVFLPGLPALMTGAPVGEWHLTIGNPFNPIVMIGNLICDGLELEFNEELGPDDFPTEVKATISLKHGMPRDKASIEAMFNRGKGKIYTLPDEIDKALQYTTYGRNATQQIIDNRGNTGGNDKNIHSNSNAAKELTQQIDNAAKNSYNFVKKESLAIYKYGMGYSIQKPGKEPNPNTSAKK